MTDAQETRSDPGLPEALRANYESYLAAIVQSSDDAILSKTLDGTVTSWNEAAERMYGYRAEDIVGKNIATLVPPDRRQEVTEILTRLAEGHRFEHFETRRVTRDGRVLEVSLTISPIKDTTGKVVGASTIARDVTERRNLERALSRYTKELEQSNRDLERYAYVVSHDLAEPLRMVSSFAQLLEEEVEALDERPREYIRFILEGTGRMRALIDDLLAYSRLGSAELGRTSIEMDEIVAFSTKSLEAKISESGAEIRIDGPLPEVFADPVKIEQLMTNLLANAIKFKRPDEVPRIEISAARAGEGYRFEVADNGIGVEDRHRDRIFEMFQRLHTRDLYEGTGVGLAICKRIVERHGGAIGHDRNTPVGSRFWFTLPDVRATDVRAPRVLVVEDNAGDVLLMRQGFSGWTVVPEVDVVGNGEDAIAFLRRRQPFHGAERPDVVILDLNLPKMRGAEVLTVIRSDAALRDIPVAVMSSSGHESPVVAPYDPATTWFIPKPMEVIEYRAVVKTIEQLWRAATGGAAGSKRAIG